MDVSVQVAHQQNSRDAVAPSRRAPFHCAQPCQRPSAAPVNVARHFLESLFVPLSTDHDGPGTGTEPPRFTLAKLCVCPSATQAQTQKLPVAFETPESMGSSGTGKSLGRCAPYEEMESCRCRYALVRGSTAVDAVAQ